MHERALIHESPSRAIVLSYLCRFFWGARSLPSNNASHSLIMSLPSTPEEQNKMAQILHAMGIVPMSERPLSTSQKASYARMLQEQRDLDEQRRKEGVELLVTDAELASLVRVEDTPQ
jgi:hypothetical protein